MKGLLGVSLGTLFEPGRHLLVSVTVTSPVTSVVKHSVLPAG